MKSLIPKYTYRGMENKLPSAGDPVGNGPVTKSACYSGVEAPTLGSGIRNEPADESGRVKPQRKAIKRKTL